MIDIFGSFATTLIAYLLGVLVVLTLGLQASRLIERSAVENDLLSHSSDGESSTSGEKNTLQSSEKQAENETADANH